MNMKRSILILAVALIAVNLSFAQETRKEYYDNGNLKEVGTYKYDDLHGDFKSYYESGNLKEVITFEFGLPTGEYKVYHENGQLYELGEYRSGVHVGEWKKYHENGQLLEIGTYGGLESVEENGRPITIMVNYLQSVIVILEDKWANGNYIM